jgi:hypothetical protein
MPSLVLAQPTWQRSTEKEKIQLELLHAVVTANFPTAETLRKGDFHYEISHRFHPPIEEGYDANFGFDGPVSMRTALGYGLTDRLMLTLGRSTVLDNLDLQVKYRWLQVAHDEFPSALAVCGGIAWSTEMPALVDRRRMDADNFQYYIQFIYNTLLLDGRLGIGIVPSYLYNSAIFSVDRQYTFTLGSYYQYYFDDMWGLWAEYNPALSGYQGILVPGEAGRSHDSVAFGISIETGGHFFYLFATNNTRLNPAQYLVGASSDASPDNWRIAFGITRYL